jgi:hypothetical protein
MDGSPWPVVGTALADEFAIELRTVDTMRLRHLRFGHRFIFSVNRIGGRRILGSGPIFGNAKAPVSAGMLMGAAWIFAEREARAAGLID